MAATAPKLVFSHITKNPQACGGKACIDATRIRAIDVVRAQSEGYTPVQIRNLFAVTLTLAHRRQADPQDRLIGSVSTGILDVSGGTTRPARRSP